MSPLFKENSDLFCELKKKNDLVCKKKNKSVLWIKNKKLIWFVKKIRSVFM